MSHCLNLCAPPAEKIYGKPPECSSTREIIQYISTFGDITYYYHQTNLSIKFYYVEIHGITFNIKDVEVEAPFTNSMKELIDSKMQRI